MLDLFRKKRVYLDYAASTPTDTRVMEAMRPYFTDVFAAPGSLHEEGWRAKEALRKSRESVAQALSCRASEIVFTSGGTESNYIAIAGTIGEARKTIENPEIVISTIEHASVREMARGLEREGVRVRELSVDEGGMVRADEIEGMLTPETALVSIMYVNNEIGTVQPIRETGQKIQEYRKKHHSTFPYFHTDASQAPLYFDCAPERLSADLLTLDGHKIYGPKGVGLLFKKHDAPIVPPVVGGGQEGGIRPGTPALPLIVGFSEAVSIAVRERKDAEKATTELRDFFISEIEKAIPGVILNGDRKKRSPNNVNITIPGLSSERLMYALDEEGIACATKSACLEEKGEGSYVLSAIGRSGVEGGLRFTLGKETTRTHIVEALEVLERVVKKERSIT